MFDMIAATLTVAIVALLIQTVREKKINKSHVCSFSINLFIKIQNTHLT